jgi:pimeloyl-ACP methyl ester carboxylesterase
VSDHFEEKVAVIDRGTGPAILFAHGMGLDCRLFEPQVEALSRDYRTVAYNLRAHSARGADQYTLYDLVSDFTAELDQRGIDRCVLVGMSMGGYMAVRAALRTPKRLYGIVLIGASAVPFPEDDVTAWRTDAERWRYRATLGLEQGRADAEQNFSATMLKRRPQLITLWSERIARRGGAASYCEFLTWAFQDDVRQAFAQQVKLPCLLIHGQEDTAVPLAHALETHRLMPNARLLVLPYAGHAANLEYPETVNEALRTFCADCFAHS